MDCPARESRRRSDRIATIVMTTTPDMTPAEKATTAATAMSTGHQGLLCPPWPPVSADGFAARFLQRDTLFLNVEHSISVS